MSNWYARPVFHVADVQASIDFYSGKLGFTEAWRFVEDGQLFVAEIEREGCAIIVSNQWPEKRGKGLLFVSLGDGSLATLDAARADLEARGAPVRDGQWGYKLFVVEDPDGNQLFFNYPAVLGAGPGGLMARFARVLVLMVPAPLTPAPRPQAITHE